MTDKFNLLPWHDAQLLELSIDRRDPGSRDEVCVRVAWPESGSATLFFRDCYAFSAEMNFGVISEERISRAFLNEADLGLISIRGRWERLGVSLDSLSCYQLETSSTASIIRIYAKQFDAQQCL